MKLQFYIPVNLNKCRLKPSKKAKKKKEQRIDVPIISIQVMLLLLCMRWDDNHTDIVRLFAPLDSLPRLHHSRNSVGEGRSM